MMSSGADRLLDVVTELLVTEGYDGISVRKVANHAGVSIGAVQHHFPTKDVMLAAAAEKASTDFAAQLRRRVPGDVDASTALRELAGALLGVEPEQRELSVLWLVRAARAAVDPATAELHVRDWGEVARTLTGLVWASRTDRDEAWATDQAAALLALIDGLGLAALLEPGRMPAARARTLTAAAVARILAS